MQTYIVLLLQVNIYHRSILVVGCQFPSERYDCYGELTSIFLFNDAVGGYPSKFYGCCHEPILIRIEICSLEPIAIQTLYLFLRK